MRAPVSYALLSLLLIAGCAKTPATTAASAPAPTGSAAGGRMAATSATATGSARPSPREFSVSADVKDVYFDFDKYEIRPDATKTLDADAAWLNTNRGHLVLIEGHCDERGTSAYNLALGERRARATLNYLVAHGVASSRITVVTYGEERPVCTEKNEGCWAKNRRAHLLVKAQ
ncbi:MAG: peptidoglycan-associated lipoprotein Pal [Candidatus Rokubacteria bacterium]|nr:peptidoglycan-associated lipoprotein Pal [Candidatus Rokubacteria bacterium]